MTNQNLEDLKKNFEKSFKKQKFQQAVMDAEKGNLIDKQIQAYDAMIKYWAHIEPDAGPKMFKLGLLKKAKQYFEAYGDINSPLYKDIEQLISEGPEEFKENSRAYIECTRQLEEKPFGNKMLYNFTINDLKKYISLKEKIKKEYSKPDIKN